MLQNLLKSTMLRFPTFLRNIKQFSVKLLPHEFQSIAILLHRFLFCLEGLLIGKTLLGLKATLHVSSVEAKKQFCLGIQNEHVWNLFKEFAPLKGNM